LSNCDAQRNITSGMPEFDKAAKQELAALIKDARELREQAHRLIERSESLRKLVEHQRNKPSQNKPTL
jgi:hypothetical protein